jgi:hypothetical protein
MSLVGGEVYRKARTVHCEDAVKWLQASSEPLQGSVFCGIPDIADVYGFIPSDELAERARDYQRWFIDTLRSIFSRIQSGQCVIFSQTDGRVIDKDGTVVSWLDKAHLCSTQAESFDCQLLWHKIAIDSTASVSSHRPCYTHLLCFGKEFRYHTSQFLTPDVIERGTMTWDKATGLEACVLCIAFLRYVVNATCIINPFCGQGTILAVADYFGVPSVGIEIMAKRARKAQCKDVRSRIDAIPRERLRSLLGGEISRQLGLETSTGETGVRVDEASESEGLGEGLPLTPTDLGAGETEADY